jgi:hypothetical protein
MSINYGYDKNYYFFTFASSVHRFGCNTIDADSEYFGGAMLSS